MKSGLAIFGNFIYLPQAVEMFIVKTAINVVIENAYIVPRNPDNQ